MSLLFLFGIVLIGILIIAFLVSITLAFQLYKTSSEPRYLVFCTTGLFSLAAGGASLKFNWQDWKSGTLVVNEIDWADVALGLVIVGGIVVVWFVTAYKPRRNNNLMLCQHS